jgi:hypothetical protein
MRLIFIVLLSLLITAAPPANAELIASHEEPKLAQMNPLQNGLSAITFVWAISDFSLNRVTALQAGLSTILDGGTATLSAYDAETYREVNDISITVSPEENDILLTLSAPNAVFPDALKHLNALLRRPSFSQQWYRRELLQIEPGLATKNRSPNYVMSVMMDYARYPVASDGTDVRDLTFEFGMPRQIIIRSAQTDTQPLIDAAASGLPLRATPLPVVNKPAKPIALPKGVIFAPDPDAKETMIFVVNHKSFASAESEIGANLMLDYMGAYQGSEMFRIIRQEMRAAYDPSSNFSFSAHQQAMLALSATVVAQEWPTILQTINDIYTSARAGNATDTGLANNQRRLLSAFEYNFATNAHWTANQYLAEYPDGTKGKLLIPLFSALVRTEIESLRANAAENLPPFSDFLVILIGGSLAPTSELQTNQYCEQPLSKPLRYCLEILQSQQP